MSNKKIQLLFDYFYPSSGGVQVNLLQVYSRLVTSGWEVDAFVCNFDPGTNETYPPREKIKGINVYRYSFFVYNFLPFIINIDFNSDGIISLHDFIILPHYYVYLITLLRKIFKRKKYKLILDSHGLFSNTTDNYQGFEYIRRLIKKLIDRSIGIFLLNHTVDAIRAVSVKEQNSLISCGVLPELITVINNGVDFADTDLPSIEVSEKTLDIVRNYKPYIFQMARLDPNKNFETVIRAMPKMNNDIKLLIIGPDRNKSYKLKLTKLVEKLNLKDRVIFTGEIQGKDKYYIMRNALAYVHMAINEGYGNTIIESMSQSCVCFVSDDITPEVIQDGFNGFRIPMRDSDVLAEKINLFYANQGESVYLKIRENSENSTKNKTWGSVADKIDSLYSKVVIGSINI